MIENGTHAHDWDEQFERLSAYADEVLEPADRAEVEAHLPTCSRCQAALADLRATRALVRALPAVTAPRSFAIPAHTGAPVAPAIPVRLHANRPRPLPLARAAQWLGGLAAAIGLAILLGSALLHAPANTTTAGSASYGAAARQATSTATATPPATTDQSTKGQRPSTAPAEGSTSTATPAPQPTPVVGPTGASQPEAPVGPIAGGGLLVIGGGVFVAGTLAERRRRHERA